jgi:hypothetical protein
METTITLFKKGDVLIWDPSMLNRPGHPRDRRGNGPFTVVEAMDVPTDCLFPDTYCALGGHSENCNVPMYMSVGHPQWVAIRLPNGEVPQDTGIDRNSLFSGVWFIHA